MTAPRHQDLTKTTFGVLTIGVLIATSFWILRPFLGATIWATMVVVATWPGLQWIEARLWKRRGLAVAAMTVLLLLVFVLPLSLAISTIATHGDEIVDWVRSLISGGRANDNQNDLWLSADLLASETGSQYGARLSRDSRTLRLLIPGFVESVRTRTPQQRRYLRRFEPETFFNVKASIVQQRKKEGERT